METYGGKKRTTGNNYEDVFATEPFWTRGKVVGVVAAILLFGAMCFGPRINKWLTKEETPKKPPYVLSMKGVGCKQLAPVGNNQNITCGSIIVTLYENGKAVGKFDAIKEANKAGKPIQIGGGYDCKVGKDHSYSCKDIVISEEEFLRLKKIAESASSTERKDAVCGNWVCEVAKESADSCPGDCNGSKVVSKFEKVPSLDSLEDSLISSNYKERCDAFHGLQDYYPEIYREVLRNKASNELRDPLTHYPQLSRRSTGRWEARMKRSCKIANSKGLKRWWYIIAG